MKKGAALIGLLLIAGGAARLLSPRGMVYPVQTGRYGDHTEARFMDKDSARFVAIVSICFGSVILGGVVWTAFAATKGRKKPIQPPVPTRGKGP